MGAREVESLGLGPVGVTAAQQRAAAVHIADRVGAEHPHPLDELMPKLAGRQLAADPVIADGVIELLDALGLLPADFSRLRVREAELRTALAVEAAINEHLKEQQ